MSALNVSYKSIADHCMKKLAELGYEKKFVNGTYVGMMHGLGHGVGLEIHEEPRVNTRSESVIEKGDVFTIEPGLYYPEIGGVRIEDSLFVDQNGDIHKCADFGYEWVIE